MEAPRLTLMNLLEAQWAGAAPTPTFTATTLDPSIPGDLINVRTMPERRAHITNDTIEGRAELAVEVYTRDDETRREVLIAEVNRILDAYQDAPGGDLTFLELGSRSDIGDDPNATPPVYLSMITTIGVWYE